MRRKITAVLIALAFSSPLVSYARDGSGTVTTLMGAPYVASPPDAASPIPEQIKRVKELLQQKISGQSAGQAVDMSTPSEPKPNHVENGTSPNQTENEISVFEAYVKGKSPLTISTSLKQFGYDLFKKPPDTFAPTDRVAVRHNYILGPGDELIINVWGKVNAQYSPSIDRDGKIVLPQLGPLYIAGLTFSEAKTFLEKEFTRLYKRSGARLNISMGRLRSIRVFVVGKAERPGSYTLSSLSTLVNALFAAGGPSKIGTMRDIQVRRNGRTIVHFDMYDFLLKGDKTQDIRLLPEDVIFIPTSGPMVGIAGNVKAPAIYELKGKTKLTESIDMAGGINAMAYLQQIQLERIVDNEAKIVFDLNLKELTRKGDIPLEDGDVIKVFSVIEIVTNSMELKGNVLRPGTYEWKKGIQARDIIKNPEELLPDTLLDFVLVERLVPPDYHKEYLSFNIGKLLIDGDERENLPLMPYDVIVVFNKWDLMDKEKVRVTGALNRPGEYEYRPNMKLSDIIKLAGGIKRYALAEKAELTRVTPTPEGPVTEKIIVNLEKALDMDPEYDIPLQEDDYLFVRTVPEWELYRVVTISGEVKFPGKYTVKKGEPISSLIERAGGYTDGAYLKGAVFTRESVRELQQKQLDDSIDRLEQQILAQSASVIEGALEPAAAMLEKAAMVQRKALIGKMRAVKAKGRISIKLSKLKRLKRSSSNLIMEEGDELHIPERPQQVQVIGAVYNQTAFIYSRGKSVSSYINKAGGITNNADKSEIYVLKVNGTAVSKRARRSLMSMKLDPGDTIVVPEEIDRIAWLRDIKDITQILYQTAIAAGIFMVVF